MQQDLVGPTLTNFVNFLNRNYHGVQDAHQALVGQPPDPSLAIQFHRPTFEEFFDDWAQANWELFVERVLCVNGEFLFEYGDGSDYEGDLHARVFFHRQRATHEIVCESSTVILDRISGNPVLLTDFEFESFVTMAEGWYCVSPPFDHALLSKRGEVGLPEQIVVPLDLLTLTVCPIASE